MYKNIKVKCYSADIMSELEGRVNIWIEKEGKEIIDIKHSVSMCISDGISRKVYTALIIYIN